LTSLLPGWCTHFPAAEGGLTAVVVEHSEPQLRHWDVAFRFCERGCFGVWVPVGDKLLSRGDAFTFVDEEVPWL
jgi:hypothetical protein